MDSLKAKLRLIVEESSKEFKHASDFLADTRRPLYAVNMLEAAVLYQRRWVPVGDEFFPMFIGASYDLLQLLFLEGSIVRGVRYSGMRELGGYMFSVKSLELGGERRFLFPTFITRGRIERRSGSAGMLGEEKISTLSLLFHQPKPFVFSEEAKEHGRVSFVITSPLAGMEFVRDNRRCMVAPFLALAQVSFRRATEGSGYIFCYPRSTKYVRANLRLFLYNVKGENVVTQVSDWFPVFVLKSALKYSKELGRAFEERSVITAGALLAIDSDEGYAVSVNARRVLRLLPGALVLVSMYPHVLEYSLLNSADVMESLNIGAVSTGTLGGRKVALKVGVPRSVIDKVRWWLASKIGSPRGLPLVSGGKLVSIEKGYLFSLSPPMLALSAWHGVNVDELLEQRGVMGLLSDSVRTVTGYMAALRAWEAAKEGYKVISEKYGLYTPI